MIFQHITLQYPLIDPLTEAPLQIIDIRVLSWRDVDGYVARDYGPRPTEDRTFLRPSGEQIEGRSGIVECFWHEAHKGQRLWREVSRIDNLEGLTRFMDRHGPLSEVSPERGEDIGWPRARLPEPQSFSGLGEMGLVAQLSDLAATVDALDRQGFIDKLAFTPLGSPRIYPRGTGAPWTLQFPSLFELLKYEMLCEFGDEELARPAHLSMRPCANCGKTIATGGRRGATRRADAKFCSDSCRVAAHNRNKKQAP